MSSFLLLFIFSSAMAKEAHVHGAAKVDIAFQGTTGQIEFEAPGHDIVGFEHVAKTVAQKQQVKDTLQKIETKMAEMLVFDPTLACQFKKEKVEIHQEKNHSSVEASYSVSCFKSPAGTILTVNMQKFFPKLKDIDFQIIVDNLQKSAEVKGPGSRIEFK